VTLGSFHADEEARKNFEKYGHPDGKQAMDMGIAIPLPTGGENGPIILALLVFIGLVLPMGVAAWFLFSSSKFMGPNQIMQETINIFAGYPPPPPPPPSSPTTTILPSDLHLENLPSQSLNMFIRCVPPPALLSNHHALSPDCHPANSQSPPPFCCM